MNIKGHQLTRSGDTFLVKQFQTTFNSIKDTLEGTAVCFLHWTAVLVDYVTSIILNLFSGFHCCVLTKLTLCLCYTERWPSFNRDVLIITLSVAVLLIVIAAVAVMK